MIGKKEQQAPELYLIAGCGGKAVLKAVAQSPLRERLLIRNDSCLRTEGFSQKLMNKLTFFAPEGTVASTLTELEALFPVESIFHNPKTGEGESLKVSPCPNGGQAKGQLLVSLEIQKKPYRIPIQLEILPYQGQGGYPQEETLPEGISGKGTISYCKFNAEEYLARCFYQVLDSLEWLDDFLWYQEIYSILSQKAVNGRKVWDSLRRLLLEQPIPFVQNRLDTLKGYEGYAPMADRWDALHAGMERPYPTWQEAIRLLGEFYTPIFEGILKDEIFFGDWMPQLKRYLD